MCSARDNAALPVVRFAHSEIRGSMAIQRLTAAYRSRSRPSSTLGAKASTMCPYYLDGDLFGRGSRRSSPGDTRFIGYCAVFKVREEAYAPRGSPGPGSSEPPAVRRSLKTQQHASRLAWTLRSSRAACQIRSTCLVADRSRESVAELESSGRRSAGDRCPLVVEGSLERR